MTQITFLNYPTSMILTKIIQLEQKIILFFLCPSHRFLCLLLLPKGNKGLRQGIRSVTDISSLSRWSPILASPHVSSTDLHRGFQGPLLKVTISKYQLTATFPNLLLGLAQGSHRGFILMGPILRNRILGTAKKHVERLLPHGRPLQRSGLEPSSPIQGGSSGPPGPPSSQDNAGLRRDPRKGR